MKMKNWKNKRQEEIKYIVIKNERRIKFSL